MTTTLDNVFTPQINEDCEMFVNDFKEFISIPSNEHNIFKLTNLIMILQNELHFNLLNINAFECNNVVPNYTLYNFHYNSQTGYDYTRATMYDVYKNYNLYTEIKNLTKQTTLITELPLIYNINLNENLNGEQTTQFIRFINSIILVNIIKKVIQYSYEPRHFNEFYALFVDLNNMNINIIANLFLNFIFSLIHTHNTFRDAVNNYNYDHYIINNLRNLTEAEFNRVYNIFNNTLERLLALL